MVVDASAIVDYLFLSQKAIRVSAAIEAAPRDLHVPEHCDLEVLQSMRKPLRSGRLTPERALAALDDYLDLPLVRHRHAGLLDRVLALRDSFTAYDAAYVALAERLDAAIVTTDDRFARALLQQTALDVVAL